MSRLTHRYCASLAVLLATFFLLGGCLQDKEKAEARRLERLQSEVFSIQEDLLLGGDADKAIAQLDKLNTKHPNQLEVVEALGLAYDEKGDYLMAAFFFDHALELAPEQASIAFAAARAHEKSDNPGEAVAAYRTYLRLNPQATDIWRNIALLETAQQNYQPALAAYLEVLRANKEQPSAQDKLNVANLYHKLGNQPQAQRWYEDLLGQEGVEPSVQVGGMVGLFDLSLRQRQWERALELMYAAEKLSPGVLKDGEYASAYNELYEWDNTRKAAAKAEQEKVAAAAKAAKEKADAAQVVQQKAVITTGAEKVAQAATTDQGAQAADAAKAPETTSGTAGSASATVASAAGTTGAVGDSVSVADADSASATVVAPAKVAEAVTVAETVAVQAADGTVAEAVVIEATPAKSTVVAPEVVAPGAVDTAATSGGEPVAAASAGAVASASANATAPASVPVADTAAAGQVAAASVEESAAQAQDASAAELAARGRAAFEAKDFATAAEVLERSVKLNPNDAEVLDLLSRASYEQGRYPQAERYAMLATYAQPQEVNYRLEYLRAYQRNHPPASMLQQLITAREAFPTDPNVALALARGYEYIAGRKALAAALYHEYLEKIPNSPLAPDISQKLLEWEM